MLEIALGCGPPIWCLTIYVSTAGGKLYYPSGVEPAILGLVEDTISLLEYYKLAALVIPVLWLGNVLQQLDPDAARRAVQPLNERLNRIEQQALNPLELDPSADPARLEEDLTARQAKFATIQERMQSPEVNAEDLLRDLTEMQKLLEDSQTAAAAMIERKESQGRRITAVESLLKDLKDLRAEKGAIGKRFRPLALLALLALPIAVLSEVFSLYGVATGTVSGFVTWTITIGLVLGGTLLIAPLFFGWVRLLLVRSWLR